MFYLFLELKELIVFGELKELRELKELKTIV